MKSTKLIENISYSIVSILFVWYLYILVTKGFPMHGYSKPGMVDLGFFFLFVFVVFLPPFLSSFSFTSPMLRVGILLWFTGAVMDMTASTFNYYIALLISDYSLLVKQITMIINLILSFIALVIFSKERLRRGAQKKDADVVQ